MSKSLLLLLFFFFTQELTIPYLDPAFPYFLLIAETQKRKEKCEWSDGVNFGSKQQLKYAFQPISELKTSGGLL